MRQEVDDTRAAGDQRPGALRTRRPPFSLRGALATALIVAAVIVIYQRSTSGYFFDDDFHWLLQTQGFQPAAMLDLSRYDHFYRPVIETYFSIGLSLFGCRPFPFHVASVGIHLLTIGVLFRFAGALSASWPFAFLSALFFAVQPGLTDAVTWIGAITDQLPVLWYLLALWAHLRHRQGRGARWYVLSLVAFVLCHLTHESAATLLPMMLLVEVTFVAEGPLAQRLRAVLAQWTRYAPFAVLLAGYLALAYVVNTRSYLVQEGHYAFGLHAIPNVLDYIVWLYVGRRRVIDYVLMVAVLAAVLVWGSPRMRFAVLWMFVTLAPASFFTWGNAARYLYLPAAGFAMLVADLVLAAGQVARRRVSAPAARVVTIALVTVLAARFGVFAKKAADSFPARAAPYERFVAELRRANPKAAPGSTVFIDPRAVEGVPDLYREPAARVGLCLADVRLQVR